MVNTLLLQRELDHITNNPDGWDQMNWAWSLQGTWAPPKGWDHPQLIPVSECGTAFCLAGNTVVHAGWVFVTDKHARDAEFVIPGHELDRLGQGEDVSPSHADMVACELLGLDLAAGENILFDGHNSLTELWTYAYAITDGAIRLPKSLPRVTGREMGNSPAADTPGEVRRMVASALRILLTGGRMVVVDYLDRNRKHLVDGMGLLPLDVEEQRRALAGVA